MQETREKVMQGRLPFTWLSTLFLGADLMRRSKAATLDAEKMRQIRDIIVAKYAIKRCIQDKNARWDKCRKAIGQKCKNLRYKK